MTTTGDAPVSVRRVRYDLRPRRGEVTEVTRLTPHMTRVTLRGDLDDLPGGAPTDHVKVFFPPPGEREPAMPTLGENGLVPPPPGVERLHRDYTVRRHRPELGEIDLDFVLHGDGLAGRWAAGAAVGDRLGVLGPRGSHMVDPERDWWLLAGDETALPALGRWLEELPAGARVTALVEVADAAEELQLRSAADVDLRWLHRDGTPAGGSALLAEAVAAWRAPSGRGFAWVAGEADALRPVRRDLRERLDPADVDVDGYWRRGVVDHDHHAPTG